MSMTVRRITTRRSATQLSRSHPRGPREQDQILHSRALPSPALRPARAGHQELKSSHSSRPSRRVPFFWKRAGDACPSYWRAVQDHIEKHADAARYCEVNLRALRSRTSLRAIARAIHDCADEAPCGQILCPHCAREYRLWLASEVLHLVSLGLPAFVATILLTAAEGPDLSLIDVRLLHERTRKRLIRSGVQAAIGGTEAKYKSNEDRWVVHLHLLVFGLIDQARPRLRRAFRDATLEKPVVCQHLRNPVAQISYLQKFVTCHRPGQPGFRGRGRAYPMKAAQIVQLARWTEGCRFEDFLFLLGLRRRGSRFEAERGFKDLLSEHQIDRLRWRRWRPWRRSKEACRTCDQRCTTPRV